MRPRRIGTFSQWLKRTKKRCFLTTSTAGCSGNVLVEITLQSGNVEWLIDEDPYLVSLDAPGMN
jgi:hypothetical protein